jgi:hypothetical protein
MQTASQGPRARTVVALSLLMCSFFVSTAGADVLESAKLLPDDTMVMISVESVNGLRAAFEKTSVYALYKDPAVQPLVGEAEKKIRETIDTFLKDFWNKNKIENPPEHIPFPEGRLVAGLSLVAKAAEVKAGGDESEEQKGGPGMDMRFALVADMGAKAAQVKQLMRSLSARATDAGSTVQRKEMTGVEMDIIVPAKDSDDPAISYGMKDNWLLVTADTSGRTDFTESVAGRLTRALPGSLKDKPGFAAMMQSLGDAPVALFVNADALKALAASRLKDKAAADRIIKGLGLGNVTGLASTAQIAAQRNQDLCVKTLLAVQGPQTGIPALLGAPSSPLRLNNRLLTRDAVGFVSANYEPLKLFDAIAKMVGEVTGAIDLNMMVQAAMMSTAKEAGQPPVQVRDDILMNVTGPVLMTWKMDRTGKASLDSLSPKFLVALSVQDGSKLNTALGRIHQAFLGQDPKLRRELLGRTLYLLPARSPGGMVQAASGETSAPANQMAFAVAGDTLVLGLVDEVEQAIRSLQKEPENSIAADPMFRYAREYLPSQAGLFYYRNDRLNAQTSWDMIKEMLRGLQNQAQGEGAANPLVALLQKVSPYVDLSKLPEFSAVEKYFGATVGFMQTRPDGIYWETTALKPPQQ